jgi:hypothetical protein
MRRTTTAGFSAIEFILVTAVTGILVLGLTAMIDVPQRVAIKEQAANPSIAATDTSISALDQDIRFALDVRAPTERRLEIDRQDGGTVVWEWNGLAGRSLNRTDQNGGVAVLRDVKTLRFTLLTQKVKRRGVGSGSTDSSSVRTSEFSTFSLKPGYVLSDLLGGLLGGLTAVTEIVNLRVVSPSSVVGVKFTGRNLDDDDALATQIVLPVQRHGTGDLEVVVYEALPGNAPDRTKAIARGLLYNRQIPVATAPTAIPFTAVRKLQKDKNYFVEIRGVNGATAARIETRSLSIPAAVLELDTALSVSSDGGGVFNPLVALAAAGQVRFSLDGLKTRVLDSGGGTGPTPGVSETEIPVRVGFAVEVNTPGGPEEIRASFPILNKLAEASR